MRLLMLETRRGSEDGFAVRRFERGKIYDIADALARMFIRAGWAIEFPSLREGAGEGIIGNECCNIDFQ